MEWNEESKKKILNELSDVMWYVAFTARNVLGVSIEEIIDANVEKLQDRYKTGKFTTEEFMVKENSKRD